MTRSGYFEIGIYHPKKEVNVGGLWRSAYIYGAAGIFTIGRRYEPQDSDTTNTDKHIPLREYSDFADFMAHRPYGCELVAVEQYGKPSHLFEHPMRAIYLLGAEDNGLPKDILAACQHHIEIATPRRVSLNVASAGTVVLSDRYTRSNFG